MTSTLAATRTVTLESGRATRRSTCRQDIVVSSAVVLCEDQPRDAWLARVSKVNGRGMGGEAADSGRDNSNLKESTGIQPQYPTRAEEPATPGMLTRSPTPAASAGRSGRSGGRLPTTSPGSRSKSPRIVGSGPVGPSGTYCDCTVSKPSVKLSSMALAVAKCPSVVCESFQRPNSKRLVFC